MPIFTALAIYFVIWWIVLFAVLPWGVHSQHESGEMTPGTDPPYDHSRVGGRSRCSRAVMARMACR